MARRLEDGRDLADLVAHFRWLKSREATERYWAGRLPSELLRKQIAFERRHTALRMHLLGITGAVIADQLGISVRRAAVLIADAKHDIVAQRESPAQNYLREALELDRLAFMLRDPTAITVRIFPPLRLGTHPFPRPRHGLKRR